MATVAAELTSTQIKERAVEVERELETAKAKLPGALRSSAQAYLRGRYVDEVSSLREQIRKLKDVQSGLYGVALRAEYAELSEEIERRERAYDEESGRVERLRQIFNGHGRSVEGVGTALRAAERTQRADQNAAFAEYEHANLDHISERRAIDALVARRDELAQMIED